LQSIPIKSTGVPQAAAIALGFPSFKEYKLIALHQIESKSPFGEAMLNAIRCIMPTL
jgi:hypothetical protein